MEGVLKEKLGKENWSKAVKKYRLRDPLAKVEKDHDEISTTSAKSKGIIALDISPQMNDTENQDFRSQNQTTIKKQRELDDLICIDYETNDKANRKKS